MEVPSLETSTELDVLEIQYSRENQTRIRKYKRWSTVSNLAEQSSKRDIFELLDSYDILVSRMKINGKKTHARRVTFAEKVVVIRF